MTTDIGSEKRQLEVFLIEDNFGDAELVKAVMKKSKYKIHLTIARDGEEALTRLERREDFSGRPAPDLIILDLNLPKMDGRDVLSAIKGNPAYQDTPVLVWTSSAVEADCISSYRHHANLFLVKPQSLVELYATFQYLEDFWLGKIASAQPGETT